MFDGIVGIVTGVRYVPGLKRSLISWGTLDSKGCRYLSQRGVLNVSKGVMVVPKGEMSKGLYMLVGKVQTGEDAGGTTTCDSSEREVATRKQVTFVSSANGYDDLS